MKLEQIKTCFMQKISWGDKKIIRSNFCILKMNGEISSMFVLVVPVSVYVWALIDVMIRWNDALLSKGQLSWISVKEKGFWVHCVWNSKFTWKLWKKKVSYKHRLDRLEVCLEKKMWIFISILQCLQIKIPSNCY